MDKPRKRRRAQEPTTATSLTAGSAPIASRPTENQWLAIGLPALASCLALWAVQPPLGWSWLAWLAPIGLLSLVDRQAAPGKGGYFILWLAGCVYWLAILQGIRLAFWPLYFGWLALSFYLAIYIPLFVAFARQLFHVWRWPLIWSAPIAWVGLELVRSYFLTGYAASTLAHSQYQNPLVIQLADQVGGYGVGFIIMATAVAGLRLVQASQRRALPEPTWELGVAAGLLCLLLGYGAWRLNEGDRLAKQGVPLFQAALLQENTPSQFDANPERLEKAWKSYAAMSAQAWSNQPQLDLIIWPESTYTGMIPWVEDHIEREAPPEMVALNYNRHEIQRKVAELQQEFRLKTQVLLESMRQTDRAAQLPHLLVGNDVMEMRDDRVARYNAALLLDPAGQIINRYEKMHLVMFGEYIPLGWALKFLGDAFGMASADAGQELRAFQLGQVTIAPSICFESMVPHRMSWQLRTLRATGHEPEVYVNITNDSWFRGSSMLDHHLACEVLTAVELRRPFLIAANTGVTAWVGGSGRIIEQLERLTPGFIVAEPTRDSRWAMTQVWGDAPAWCMALILGMVPVRRWWWRKGRSRLLSGDLDVGRSGATN